jgi:hypothetical protein
MEEKYRLFILKSDKGVLQLYRHQLKTLEDKLPNG